MTALERVKQELGWWIKGNYVCDAEDPLGYKIPNEREDKAFTLALRLAEENERLKKREGELRKALRNLVDWIRHTVPEWTREVQRCMDKADELLKGADNQ